MKNAIAMLVFGSNLYLLGAIIQSYVHKAFINKYNLDIELVLMLGDELSEYKDELLNYFDKVKIIKKIEIKLKKSFMKRWERVEKLLINKWQALTLEEYNKVLFMDVDFLPLNKEFYDIFKLDAPAVLTNKRVCNEFNQTLGKNFFSKKPFFNNNEYINSSNYLKATINATMVLLKPDKKLYNEYLDFIKLLEGKNGFTSTIATVDEISIILFLRFYKNLETHCLPYNYSMKYWREDDDKKLAKGINFDEQIKSWKKLPILQWPEENIWHIIAKKALKKSKIFTIIYIEKLLEELNNFFQTYENNDEKLLKKYNLEGIKNLQKETLTNLINCVRKVDFTNINFEDKNIIEIMNESKKIHSKMSHPKINYYKDILNIIKK